MSLEIDQIELSPEEIAFFSEGLDALAKIKPENDAEKKERLLAKLAYGFRRQILVRMKECNISATELAKRIGVSKNAVSRHLASEGDMRLSTAVSLAYALDLEWSLPVLESSHSLNLLSIEDERLEHSKVLAAPIVEITMPSNSSHTNVVLIDPFRKKFNRNKASKVIPDDRDDDRNICLQIAF